MLEKTIKNSEEEELRRLFEALVNDDGMKRKKAREALVAKGKEATNFLIELISHPKYIFRWEAVKTLEEIRDPESITALIYALEDDKSDVRWIAAKALINIGPATVKPLLKALIKKSDSIFLLESAHHIFYDLREIGMLPANFPSGKLLSVLKNSEWSESVKLLAYEILNQLNL